jgi:tetratricopeptide (TPR) repeat protein
MPPEQLRGEKVDERADIFAVGATLYEMLCGRRAYEATNAADLMRAMLHADPPPLQGATIPAELAAAVAKAMAQAPEDRYASASAFLAELVRLAGRDSQAFDHTTLAIFGLENQTANSELEWVVTALTQGLGRKLARRGGFRIVPLERVMAARAAASREHMADPLDIGLQVACNWIMTGSLSYDGDSLSASIRVLEVGTRHELVRVSERGESSDVEQLESRLMSKLANKLGLPVEQGAVPKIAPQAYELYARGWTIAMSSERANVHQAVGLFERAVEIEPAFDKALAALAQQYGISNVFSSDPTLIERAIAYADRAIAVNPQYADPHVYKGYAHLHRDEPVEAYISFRRAMELDESNLLAHYFGAAPFLLTTSPEEVRVLHAAAEAETAPDYHRWRREQGARLLQRAIEIHRGFGWAWINLSWFHLDLENLEEARWCAEQAIKLEGTTRPPTAGVRGFLGECYRRQGDLETAQRQLREALHVLEATDHIYRDLWRGLFLCMLGNVGLQSGDGDAARAAFQQSAQHIEGRARARCGGHVRVQALAGLAQATGDSALFREAMDLYEEREGYDFSRLSFTNDDYDLVALAKAAKVLNENELCEQLDRRAREFGAIEAMY